MLDAAALRSAEARWLAERAARWRRQFAEPARLRLDSQELVAGRPPRSTASWHMAAAA